MVGPPVYTMAMDLDGTNNDVIDLRGQPLTPDMLEGGFDAVREQGNKPMPLMCPWCFREAHLVGRRWKWDCTCYADRIAYTGSDPGGVI